MNVLIVEDNLQIVRVLETYLNEAGYETQSVNDGGQAFEVFQKQGADFILLDIMLPNVDGFTICESIRDISTVPIIMITAKAEDGDRILGLEVGADDYIIKPFSPKEVVSRMKAILRRIDFEKQPHNQMLHLGKLQVNMEQRKAFYQNEELVLTKKEFELLALFISHPKKVFSRDNILDAVWGYDYYGDSRTVDSHIKRLRSKLKSQEITHLQIKTIWGEGYGLEVTP